MIRPAFILQPSPFPRPGVGAIAALAFFAFSYSLSSGSVTHGGGATVDSRVDGSGTVEER